MFSKQHRTFRDWLVARSKETSYVRKITRLHALHPQAALSQLRRHPSSRAKPLSSLKRVPAVLVSPRTMSAKERRLQQAAIDVAAEMRKTRESLTSVSNRLSVNRAAMARLLAPYLERCRGKLVLADSDRLPRAMILYDARGAYTVVVRTRADARKIGRYHAALGKWRKTYPRNPKILAPFERMVVTDENGEKHHFLTDPIALARLFASREIRFESVYRYVS